MSFSADEADGGTGSTTEMHHDAPTLPAGHWDLPKEKQRSEGREAFLHTCRPTEESRIGVAENTIVLPVTNCPGLDRLKVPSVEATQQSHCMEM